MHIALMTEIQIHLVAYLAGTFVPIMNISIAQRSNDLKWIILKKQIIPYDFP